MAWRTGAAGRTLRQTVALPTACAGELREHVTRFGNAAALCVAALVMTGIVNAFYLLPDLDSLFETSYGSCCF